MTFTVTLSNAGPSSATNVTVQDMLPAGLTFVSATPSQGSYSSGTGVWAVGTVTTATPQTLQLLATVASPTQKTNTATISHSDQFDPNTGNNSANATITPALADLSITKTDNATTVVQGQITTYTITIQNLGPTAATNVSFTDPLPPNVTFVSLSTPAGWTAATPPVGSPGLVSASNPNLASGNTAIFNLSVQVSPSAAGNIVNAATVSSATFDPNPGNNTATDTDTVVTATADFSVTKKRSWERRAGSERHLHHHRNEFWTDRGRQRRPQRCAAG